MNHPGDLINEIIQATETIIEATTANILGKAQRARLHEALRLPPPQNPQDNQDPTTTDDQDENQELNIVDELNQQKKMLQAIRGKALVTEMSPRELQTLLSSSNSLLLTISRLSKEMAPEIDSRRHQKAVEAAVSELPQPQQDLFFSALERALTPHP